MDMSLGANPKNQKYVIMPHIIRCCIQIKEQKTNLSNEFISSILASLKDVFPVRNGSEKLLDRQIGRESFELSDETVSELEVELLL